MTKYEQYLEAIKKLKSGGECRCFTDDYRWEIERHLKTYIQLNRVGSSGDHIIEKLIEPSYESALAGFDKYGIKKSIFDDLVKQYKFQHVKAFCETHRVRRDVAFYWFNTNMFIRVAQSMINTKKTTYYFHYVGMEGLASEVKTIFNIFQQGSAYGLLHSEFGQRSYI